MALKGGPVRKIIGVLVVAAVMLAIATVSWSGWLIRSTTGPEVD